MYTSNLSGSSGKASVVSISDMIGYCQERLEVFRRSETDDNVRERCSVSRRTPVNIVFSTGSGRIIVKSLSKTTELQRQDPIERDMGEFGS